MGCYKPSHATNHYNIGVDCSGFFCASIYYDGAIYEASKTHGKKGTGNFDSIKYGVLLKNAEASNWKFAEINPTEEDIETETQILKHAIPGDVFVKAYSDGKHIVIMKDINDIITDYSDVEIIHAAQGHGTYNNAWCVFIGTWKDAWSDNHPEESYNLRRLKF